MKKICLILLLVSSAHAQSQNSQIVKCRVQSPKWNALFILDTIGAGFLKVKEVGQEKVHTCSLKLTNLNDSLRGVAPTIKIEFDRGSCEPALNQANEKEILGEIAIRVDMNNAKNPKASVHWLRSAQPDLCVLEKLSLYEVQLDAKKFQEGSWGRRSTASEKKSH